MLAGPRTGGRGDVAAGGEESEPVQECVDIGSAQLRREIPVIAAGVTKAGRQAGDWVDAALHGRSGPLPAAAGEIIGSPGLGGLAQPRLSDLGEDQATPVGQGSPVPRCPCSFRQPGRRQPDGRGGPAPAADADPRRRAARADRQAKPPQRGGQRQRPGPGCRPGSSSRGGCAAEAQQHLGDHLRVKPAQAHRPGLEDRRFGTAPPLLIKAWLGRTAPAPPHGMR